MTTETEPNFDDWIAGVVNRGFFMFHEMFGLWLQTKDLSAGEMDALYKELGYDEDAITERFGHHLHDLSADEWQAVARQHLEERLVEAIFRGPPWFDE